MPQIFTVKKTLLNKMLCCCRSDAMYKSKVLCNSKLSPCNFYIINRKEVLSNTSHLSINKALLLSKQLIRKMDIYVLDEQKFI